MRFDAISRKNQIVDTGTVLHRQAEAKSDRITASLR
jgi:hypothetical protein